MVRRWIIRVAFLLGLGCVVGVWVGSYFGLLGAEKYFGGGWSCVGAVQGLGFVRVHRYASSTSTAIFFFNDHMTAETTFGEPLKFGFYVGNMVRDTSFQVTFPLWLPTGLLAGLNWLVWRKTWAKGVGRAFPVEVGLGEANHEEHEGH